MSATRARVRRVHDGVHGWVWRWTLQPFRRGAWGWDRTAGAAADAARAYLAAQR